MSAHQVLAYLAQQFTNATAGYGDTVEVFDGPAGFTPTSTLSIAVGVRYGDDSPIWVDPIPVGAADHEDDTITIWCVLLANMPTGNSIADARALADSTLLDLDSTLGNDVTLGGLAMGGCYITGQQRWLQGYTPDGVAVSVEFQIRATVLR